MWKVVERREGRMTDQSIAGQAVSERRAWYIVIVCMLAYILSFIDRQILSLLIGPIQADLQINDTEFGLLSGLAFSIFYSTMGIPIASLSDRASRPLVIASGIAVWSLATAACGLAGGFLLLFSARVMVGAGEAALSPATYSLISDLFPREKLGRATAVYSIGSFLGAGIAFLVGATIISLVSATEATLFLGHEFRSWQQVFLIVGLPGLLLAALVLLTMRDPVPLAQRVLGGVPSFGDVLRMLKAERAIFVPHIIGFTFAAMALFAILGWAPAYLMRTFDLTASTSGFWLGLVAIIGGGGGVLTSGWMMDRFNRAGRRDAPFLTGIVGAAGVVVPVSALPFATSLHAGLLLLGLSLFFASFPMPPSTAVMQIAAPAKMRSRVSAIFLFSNSMIGVTVGSMLVGLLSDHVFKTAAGIGSSIGVVASVAAVLAVVILWFGRKPFAAFAD
jgi:MFS family permease